MAAGAKGLLHRTWSPNEHKGVAAHIARDQDWLTNGPILLRNCWVTSGERTCGSLAVNTDTSHLLVYFVLLHLSNVVADIVDQRQIPGTCLATKDGRKGLTDAVHEQLTIRPGKVCCTGHRCQI